MKLEAVYSGRRWHAAAGIYKGVPYKIVARNGRYVLTARRLVVGVGMTERPVCAFGPKWKGIYSNEA